MHFAQVPAFSTVASLSRFLVAMDGDWEDDDFDIPVVVEDDARSRGAHLSAVDAVVSSRPQSRSIIYCAAAVAARSIAHLSSMGCVHWWAASFDFDEKTKHGGGVLRVSCMVCMRARV